MGLIRFVVAAMCALAIGVPRAQAADPEYWKVKAGDPIETTRFKFYLPGSSTLDMTTWNDKPVMLIYVQTADPRCTEFAKLFEEKAWPAIKEKNILCYFVSCGEPPSLIDAWADGNGITVPTANDGSAKLHQSLTDVNSAFPHIVMLDKNHLFCVGVVGGADPGTEEFMQLVDSVIDQGCTPAPSGQ
jgi:hypothetical protein